MGIITRIKIRNEKDKQELKRVKAETKRIGTENDTAKYNAKAERVDAKSNLKERQKLSTLERNEKVLNQSTTTQAALRKNNLSYVQTVQSSKQAMKGVYGIGTRRSIEQMQSIEETGNTKRSAIGEALDKMKQSYVSDVEAASN